MKGSKMEAKDESWKCELVDNMLEPCKGLENSIADYYHKSKCKCIISSVLVNTETGSRRTQLSLKSGDYSEKWIVINYCPFCGKMIQTYDIEQHTKLTK